MGLFEYLFGKKKKEQERLRLEEESRIKKQEQELELERQREEYALQQAIRKKENEAWLEENHKRAMERKYRQAKLREHMKESNKEIFKEYERRKKEQELQEHEYQRRIEENRRKMAEQQAKQKDSAILKIVPRNIQDIIDAATIGLMAAQQGNSRMEQQNLFNLFNLTQAKSSQLLHIPADKYNVVGSDFCLLLEYPQIRANEDISRAIADYAFFCISKAIEHDPRNKTLYLKRVSVVALSREFFFYTVANALEIPDCDPLDILLSAPLIVRTNDFIYAMGKYDFEKGEQIAYEGILREFHNHCYSPYVNKTADDGKKYIDKVNDYIANSISKY